MERRSYYRILGVSRSESASAIRSAYRELARRFHPDVAGAATTRAFQEITEAYEVLSDPRRRREYNDALMRAERADRRVIPVRRAPLAAEPVDTDDQTPIRSFDPRRLAAAPGAARLQRLDVEVLLEPVEAARGCLVPVDVPVLRRCPRCRGAGREGRFACATCRASGVIATEAPIAIRIPPGLPHGTLIEVRLGGVCDLRLRVLVAA